MITLQTGNTINIVSKEIGLYRIDLLHITSNNLYPILCQSTNYDSYVTLQFDLSSEYEKGEYEYTVYCNDEQIETGLAKILSSVEQADEYTKQIKITVYER